jgi:hypothetical protein
MDEGLQRDRNRLHLLAAGCGIAAWLFYLWRAAPTTYLLDSSELVNATWSLGISHPPGHPGFHLLSYLAGLVPIGPYPWRIHLFAASCTALAVAMLPLIADRLASVTTRFALLTVGSFTLLVGASTALVLQSIRGEVYSLHLLVAVATLWLMASAERLGLRALTLCAVVLGVGLLNHHYLTFFLFPAVLVWLMLARFGGRATLAGVAASLLVGLSLVGGYAALFARGAARPNGSWAWPESMENLYWVVSAQAFQKTAAKVVTVDVATGLSKVSLLFMELVGPLGLLLGAAGLIGLAGRPAADCCCRFQPRHPVHLRFRPVEPRCAWLFYGLRRCARTGRRLAARAACRGRVALEHRPADCLWPHAPNRALLGAR